MGKRTAEDLAREVNEAASLVDALAEWTGDDIIFRLHTSGHIRRDLPDAVLADLWITDQSIVHRVGSLRTRKTMVEVAALDAWVLVERLSGLSRDALRTDGHTRPLGAILKDNEVGYHRQTLNIAPLDQEDLSGHHMCLEVRAALMHSTPVQQGPRPLAVVRERLYSSLLEL